MSLNKEISRREVLTLGAVCTVAASANLVLLDSKLSTLFGSAKKIARFFNPKVVSTRANIAANLSPDDPRIPAPKDRFYSDHATQWAPLLTTQEKKGPAVLFEHVSQHDPIVNSVVKEHFQELVDHSGTPEAEIRPRAGNVIKKFYLSTKEKLEQAGQSTDIKTIFDYTFMALAAAHSPYWTVAEIAQDFGVQAPQAKNFSPESKWLPHFTSQLATINPAPADACYDKRDQAARCVGTDRIQHLIFHSFIAWFYLKALETGQPQMAQIDFRGNGEINKLVDKVTNVGALAVLGFDESNQTKINLERTKIFGEIVGLAWEGLETALDGFWNQYKDYSVCELAWPPNLLRLIKSQIDTGLASFDVEYDLRANSLGNFIAREIYSLSSPEKLDAFFAFLNADFINRNHNQKVGATSRANFEKQFRRLIRNGELLPKSPRFDLESLVNAVTKLLNR